MRYAFDCNDVCDEGKRQDDHDDEGIRLWSKECAGAVLGGYRPWAYIGFGIGTVYQFGLLKIAVEIIFADMEGVPDYGFDVPAFICALVVFVLLYEGIMRVYGKKMEKLSVKEIMLD